MSDDLIIRQKAIEVVAKNDDLISRQKAIEVIAKYFDFIHLNGDICIDGLISLPSKARWVPVSERIPEFIPSKKITEDVLVSDGTDLGIGYYTMNGKWCVYGYLDCDYKVMAWMPLPEPYKEAQNDD